MNPNSFKSSEEFNVDDEIAKLWASLGEEMKKMNSTTPSTWIKNDKPESE